MKKNTILGLLLILVISASFTGCKDSQAEIHYFIHSQWTQIDKSYSGIINKDSIKIYSVNTVELENPLVIQLSKKEINALKNINTVKNISETNDFEEYLTVTKDEKTYSVSLADIRDDSKFKDVIDIHNRILSAITEDK